MRSWLRRLRPTSDAVYNERVKLGATTLNAIGLGLVGVAILKPIVDRGVTAFDGGSLAWLVLGVVFHAGAHYLLGKLREKEKDR